MNAQHLIEANIKAHTVDGYSSFHMIAAAHEKTIRALATELNTLRGIGATPQNGCQITTKVFGDAEVLVEYECEGGQAAIYDADHPGVGPGCEASVNVLGVFINGAWCDAEDVVPAKTLQRWEVELLESLAEGAEA